MSKNKEKNIKDNFKGISWATPKKTFSRLSLVLLFTAALTAIAFGIDLLGSGLFKLFS